MVTNQSIRRNDLDWLRVLATLAVFFYHISMFVNPFPWHIKNNELDSGYILTFSLFMGTWMMPVFFAISGISTYYAIQKRSRKKFINERFMRLGIPLLVGVFLLSPPQVFIERISHGQFEGNFFEFLPLYVNGLYLEIGGTGNFAFVGLHLWYLLVLLLFSVLTLPLFLTKKKFFNQVEMKVLHLICLPIPLVLFATYIELVNLGGWDLLFYLVLYLYGYYFFSNPSFIKIVQTTASFSILVAISTSFIYIYWFIEGMPIEGLPHLLFITVKVVNCWSWLLVMFYLGSRYLSNENRFLQYGSQAAMPFYILHQPVIVLIGFLLYNLSWALPIKLLVLMGSSFLIIMIIYQYIIQKVELLRLLFGMKAKPVSTARATTIDQHIAKD